MIITKMYKKEKRKENTHNLKTWYQIKSKENNIKLYKPNITDCIWKAQS